MELVGHPDLARLHPTGDHPERPERVRVLLERVPGIVEAGEADPADLERCHTPAYIREIASINAGGKSSLGISPS